MRPITLAALSATFIAAPLAAQTTRFDIPAQSAATGIATLGRQAGLQVIVGDDAIHGKRTHAVRGAMPVARAFALLLEGTGLSARQSGSGSWAVTADARPPSAPATVPAATTAVSDDIVVTAQRVAEPLRKVPASVVAYSRTRMDQLGVRDFTEIAQLTPGVRLRPDINQIAIRGLASNAGAATTGVYVDDTPIQVRTFGEGAATALPFVFDLDRVEVLRGPQGTLFGAGSLGGAVRYITTQPPLDHADVYGRAEIAGTQNGGATYEGGVAAGVPLVEDKIGLRVSADYRHSGGWVDHYDAQSRQRTEPDANYQNTQAVRGALRIAPVDGLTITPSILYQRTYKNDTDQYWTSRSDPGAGRYVNANPINLSNRDRFVLPALAVAFDAGPVSIISNTAFFNRDQTRFYDNTLYNLEGYEDYPGQLLTADGPNFAKLPAGLSSKGQIDNSQRNFTQELRLQSNDTGARIQWLLGGFYSNDRQRNIETLVEPSLEQFFQSLYGTGVVGTLGAPLLPGGLSYVGNRRESERQLAFFGNLNVRLLPGVHAQAGLRWSDVRFDSDNLFSGPYIGTTPTHYVGASREHPVTPRFNLSYEPTRNLNLYASASKGYRTGGVNAPLSQRCQTQLTNAGRPIPDLPYGSDNAWSYEAGAKGRLAGVRFDASVFRIDWSNIQQRVTLDPCGVTYTLNLGQVRSQGFDLALSAQPARGFTLDLAVGYDDAYFTKPVYTKAGATSGPVSIAAGDALFQAGTPWQVVVGGRYDFQLAGRPTFARFNYEFSSRNTRLRSSLDPSTAYYNPILGDRPTTNLVQVRAGMTFGEVEAQLFVDNLFNFNKGLEAFNYGGTSPFIVNSSFRPRTFGLTLLYRKRP